MVKWLFAPFPYGLMGRNMEGRTQGILARGFKIANLKGVSLYFCYWILNEIILPQLEGNGF